MNSRREMLADDGSSRRGADDASGWSQDEGLAKVTATMKWFDATRGFGFLVSGPAGSVVGAGTRRTFVCKHFPTRIHGPPVT